MPAPRFRNIEQLKESVITSFVICKVIGLKRKKVLNHFESMQLAFERYIELKNKYPKSKFFIEKKVKNK